MAAEPKRLVRYSPKAKADLAENFDHTTQQRGSIQAERYLAFLFETAQKAADEAVHSKRMEDVAEVFVAFAKWPKAYYGHYIIFIKESGGIYILRVLHSAMDILSQFD